MKSVPPDRALRREICAALAAFVLGFVLMLAACEWAMLRFVAPEARWWGILHSCITALLISVLGGLSFAPGSVWVLSWFDCRLGVYRCRLR